MSSSDCDFFETVLATNHNLDSASIAVICNAVSKKGLRLIKVEDDLYVQESGFLGGSILRKIDHIGTSGPSYWIAMLKNIQEGNLGKSCVHVKGVGMRCSSCNDDGINIGSNGNKDLLFRYLFEKVSQMEKTIVDLQTQLKGK